MMRSFALCFAIATTHIFNNTIPLASAFTLVTFDVDGTLVKGGGKMGASADTSAHARAFSIACGTILGNGNNDVVPPVAQVLESREFHGSTDGLILLRLANKALGVEPAVVSKEKLKEMMEVMYDYIAGLSDEEVAEGISVLPGVLENLRALSTMKDRVACGLVTGNVEGIARRKMRAVGILATDALAPASAEQQKRSWVGSDDIGFLGGFGSDFCSGDIDDEARNHLDRSEQIAIAARRCRDSLPALLDGSSDVRLQRVVHVGDAPADVLAAKAYAESNDARKYNLCVGMVAVATGSYTADQLRELAGVTVPGIWEPVVLEDGMADPGFLKACDIA